MENNAKTPYAPDNLTARPIAYYMQRFREADPEEIAARTGAVYADGVLSFTVLGNTLRVDWPEFKAEGWKDYDRILFLHFLLDGKPEPAGGTFRSYPELPWGEVYDRNFRARCTMRMVRMFGTAPERFEAVSEALGGRKINGSGIIYEFEFMPGLFLRFILWPGDEEFPSSGQIVFSDNFPSSFAAEDRVVVCEYVLGKMKQVRL